MAAAQTKGHEKDKTYRDAGKKKKKKKKEKRKVGSKPQKQDKA